MAHKITEYLPVLKQIMLYLQNSSHCTNDWFCDAFVLIVVLYNK